METRVTKFRKVNGSSFVRQYPRFARKNRELSKPNKRSSRSSGWPRELEGVGPVEHLTACEQPAAGFVRVFDERIHSLVDKPNDLLLYRILRGVYGPPDVLSATLVVLEKAFIPGTLDWGYCFELPHGGVVEIRTELQGSRSQLNIWAPTRPVSVEDRQELVTASKRFVSDLNALIEGNLHMFNEKQDLDDPAIRLPVNTTPGAVINVFAERDQTGERLLVAPAAIEKATPSRRPATSGAVTVRRHGSRYLAAAAFFAISLEAFVNSLYHFLLKEPLRDRRFERLILRSEWEVRILSLHLFCSGFRRAPIAPGSQLSERISRTRDFRNNVFHGNITEENQVHAFLEDNLMFFYQPGRDYRGRGKHRSAEEEVPTDMIQLVKGDVLAVKKVVDDTVQAVRVAMDKRHRTWLDGWLSDGVITSLESAAVLPSRHRRVRR